MKQQSLLRAGIGALSLFMVLIVLSLTVLSILSYVDANQKETLANQFQEHAIAYATADQEALIKKANILNHIDETKENFMQFLESEQMVYDEVQNMVSYTVDIDVTSQLQVTLQIIGQSLEINNWQVIGR